MRVIFYVAGGFLMVCSVLAAGGLYHPSSQAVAVAALGGFGLASLARAEQQ